MKNRIKWVELCLCLIIVFSVGFIGSMFTAEAINTDWYESIKPSITPLSFVFPIVWNILFFLIGLSLYFNWVKSKGIGRKKVIIVFSINFILNILWSFFYFKLKNPNLAFIEIIILIISIISMIYVSWKINKKAAYLLIPYLLWVCFAGVLNYLSV